MTLKGLRDLLRTEDPTLLEQWQALEESDRYDLFLRLRPSERTQLLRKLPDPEASRLLVVVDSASVADPLRDIGVERARILVATMQPDDLADIAIHLPEDFRKALLEGLPNGAEVTRLLQYPEGTAGALMNTRYVSVPEVVSVARALELVRQAATVNYIYVVASDGKLVGTLSVRALLVASPRVLVRDIASKQIVKIVATARHEDLVQAFQTHKFQALPVVDDKDRIIGVVTFDDAITALREEEERLVYSVTGVDPREHLVEGMRAARGRVPWVTVTILGGLMCAGIGTIFKRTFEISLVLGLFVPLVLAIGESVSSQTAAIVMKTLITGAVERARVNAFLGKELVIGVLLGIFAGASVAGLSMLWSVGWSIALTMGGAVLISVMWAALLGVAIPYFLRRTRVDPSVASGPVVLFLCDLSTLVIYLGGAQLVLSS